jgi:protein-tyrosine phosphatase
MGISRSASLVIAFLMHHFKMTLEDAYQHTVSRRDCVEPNTKFW